MPINIKKTDINVITGTSIKSDGKRKTIFFAKGAKNGLAAINPFQISTEAVINPDNCEAVSIASCIFCIDYKNHLIFFLFH